MIGAVERQAALARLGEFHRAVQGASAGEGEIIRRVHRDFTRCERVDEVDGGVVGTRHVEQHGVAGVEDDGCGVGNPQIIREPVGRAACIPVVKAVAAPDEAGVGVGSGDGRFHPGAEVIVHIAGLHIALRRGLRAVLTVVHERVKPCAGGILGGVDAQLGIVIGHAQIFLAPVAEQVAPELRPPAVGLIHARRRLIVDGVNAGRVGRVGSVEF